MNRRNFITGMAGILASATAPWVVTSSGVLMPVRKIITAPAIIIAPDLIGRVVMLGDYVQQWTHDHRGRHAELFVVTNNGTLGFDAELVRIGRIA